VPPLDGRMVARVSTRVLCPSEPPRRVLHGRPRSAANISWALTASRYRSVGIHQRTYAPLSTATRQLRSRRPRTGWL